MPSRRFRLNKAEHRAAAQKLLERGLISRIPTWLEIPPVLDIRTDPMASNVAECPSGQVYYAVWVELVARQAGLILVNGRITTNWDDQIVLGSDEVKILCPPGGPACVLDGVLNERIENAIRFRRRGDMVRGTIIAWGLKPIPDAYRTDAIVPFELTFTDSLGNELPADGTLRVSRRRPPKTPTPKQSLFDGLVSESESIDQQQRRAYLRMLAEKGANPPELDPERIRKLRKERYSDFWIEVAKRSSSAPDRVDNEGRGGSTEGRDNASVQEEATANQEEKSSSKG